MAQVVGAGRVHKRVERPQLGKVLPVLQSRSARKLRWSATRPPSQDRAEGLCLRPLYCGKWSGLQVGTTMQPQSHSNERPLTGGEGHHHGTYEGGLRREEEAFLRVPRVGSRLFSLLAWSRGGTPHLWEDCRVGRWPKSSSLVRPQRPHPFVLFKVVEEKGGGRGACCRSGTSGI